MRAMHIWPQLPIVPAFISVAATELTRLAPPSFVTDDTASSVVSAVIEASSLAATVTLPPAETVLLAAIVVADAKSIEASTELLMRLDARIPLTEVPEALAEVSR